MHGSGQGDAPVSSRPRRWASCFEHPVRTSSRMMPMAPYLTLARSALAGCSTTISCACHFCATWSQTISVGKLCDGPSRSTGALIPQRACGAIHGKPTAPVALADRAFVLCAPACVLTTLCMLCRALGDVLAQAILRHTAVHRPTAPILLKSSFSGLPIVILHKMRCCCSS